MVKIYILAAANLTDGVLMFLTELTWRFTRVIFEVGDWLGWLCAICFCIYITGVRSCAFLNVVRGCGYSIWLWPRNLAVADFRRCFAHFFFWGLKSGLTCLIILLFFLDFFPEPNDWIKFFIPFYFFIPVVYWVVVPRRIRRGLRAKIPYWAPDKEAD